MGLVVSWVAGELDCLVGLVLVEHLVGWFVSGLGGSFGRTVGASVSQSVRRVVRSFNFSVCRYGF